jgi:hypothetical protein
MAFSSGSTAIAWKRPGRPAATSRAFTASPAQRAHEFPHPIDPAAHASGGPALAAVGVGQYILPASFYSLGNEA